MGMPEGIYPIVEATLYLSTAPKSNSAGAYFKVQNLIEQEGIGEIPNHLKDNNRDATTLGHGKGYLYPHANEAHFIPQQYLPESLLGIFFYSPSSEGYELVIKHRLEQWREAQRKALGISINEVLPDISQETINNLKQRIK
jgi:putative ATPase